jgi:hypothetical protein
MTLQRLTQSSHDVLSNHCCLCVCMQLLLTKAALQCWQSFVTNILQISVNRFQQSCMPCTAA